MFLEHAVPIVAARTLLADAFDQFRRQGIDVPNGEIYPDAATAAHAGLRHAVRLPLGIHRLTGRRYALFDEYGQPCAFTSTDAPLLFVLEWPAVAVPPLAELQQRFTLATPKGEETRDGRIEPQVGPPTSDMATGIGRVGTRSAMIRWVDAEVLPLDLLAEYAPECEMRRRGQGYLGWCPFHDDWALDGHGHPGTPSFYVVFNARHGWNWRCLSTNCAYNPGPMRHSFRLFQELLGLDLVAAICAASAKWPSKGIRTQDDEGTDDTQ